MNSDHYKIFLAGAMRLMPIAVGVIPFGMIMGTVASSASLTLLETMSMNVLIFAGASQLVAIDLLEQNTPALVIILTGITINLRFIMYSTSLAALTDKSSIFKKILMGYFITDQAYAVANLGFAQLKTNQERITFFFGAATFMALVWQLSVFLGFQFGKILPASLSLDFMVPLAFMSLVVPSIKNKKFAIVAIASSILSILFYSLPFNLGIIITAICGVSLGLFLESRRP